MPGSLPKGKWSCEENELPILGISFLDEGTQTYPGEQLMDSGEVNSHKFTQIICKTFKNKGLVDEVNSYLYVLKTNTWIQTPNPTDRENF